MNKAQRLPYNPNLKQRAQELRKQGILSEALLWRAISRKQLGVEFHRQVPIDNYIVDFLCHEKLLVIEIDGASHDSEEAQEYDGRRQARLEELGLRVLRFADRDVRRRMADMLETIREALGESDIPRR